MIVLMKQETMHSQEIQHRPLAQCSKGDIGVNGVSIFTKLILLYLYFLDRVIWCHGDFLSLL